MHEDRVQVLLVEDSPSDAQLLCESLRDYPLQKFEIERVERLDEAVALLARQSFDVILLDLNLPDSSGLETCRRISRAAGQAPIIVLTGADDEVIAAEAMCLGVQDYLVKGQAHGGMIGRTIRYAVERSQSQRALRESERQFKSTFENAAIGIAHVALDGHIRQCNSRFCEIAGYLPDDILGRTCEEITFADDWETERVRMQRLLEGRIDHYSIEKRYIRMGGGAVWVNLTRSLQRDEVGRPEYFIVIVEDISERKRAEEALRELTGTLETKVAERTAELEQRTRQLQKLALELSQAEDRERKRLAEILHDDLQQQLAASKFHLSLLGNRVRSDASLRGALSSVEEMISVAIEKSRSLSHELSPAVLYHGDFGEALEWLASQVQIKHGLAVHVEIRSPIEVSSDPIKAFLFRAAQEILFNIVKHAQVSRSDRPASAAARAVVAGRLR